MQVQCGVENEVEVCLTTSREVWILHMRLNGAGDVLKQVIIS
jgi:hypothetical protein